MQHNGIFQKAKEINLFNVKFDNFIIFSQNNRFFIILTRTFYYFVVQKRFQCYYADITHLLFSKSNFFENYYADFTFLLFLIILMFFDLYSFTPSHKNKTWYMNEQNIRWLEKKNC